MNSARINQDEYLKIARLVIEKVTGSPAELSDFSIGPLMTNYFSFVFFITILHKESTLKVFVKIPKEDLRKKKKTILPITPGDKAMADAEIASLKVLAEQWNSDDIKVSWVQVKAELPEFNAIVTKAAHGEELFMVFRRWDIQRRLGFRKQHLQLQSAMVRLGKALGRFHLHNHAAVQFKTTQLFSKIYFYSKAIAPIVNSKLFVKLEMVMHTFADNEQDALEVPTLKGIDIRNILIDKNNSLFLLDPGKLKSACRETDLARFIMTYRILYWGSSLFILGLRPDKNAEKAFLEAYYENNLPQSGNMLHLFLVKEQLKHWHTALESLQMRFYPKVIKQLVAGIYINPYYIRQLTAELKHLI